MVLAPAHRGVGASTGSFSLAHTRLTPFWKNSCWKEDTTFPRCSPTAASQRIKKKKILYTFTCVVLIVHPLASGSAQFGLLRFCPSARKLSSGSMVLIFHCNKWITGGDQIKVSGALFFAHITGMSFVF